MSFPYLRPSKLINVRANPNDDTTVICNQCGCKIDALDSGVWACPRCGTPVRKEVLPQGE